jgi:hypothetical protein
LSSPLGKMSQYQRPLIIYTSIFSSDAWYLHSKFPCSQHADCSVLKYTPWNLHSSSACFGENCSLHLVPWKQMQVPPRSWHLCMKLHGFKSQKHVTLILTAARTPNLMLKDYYMAWKRRLVTNLELRWPRFDSRSSYMGFVVNKVALGHFLRILRSPVNSRSICWVTGNVKMSS